MFCRHEAITEHYRQAAGKVCETESPEFVSPELLEAIEKVEESLGERQKKFIMLRYQDGL